MRRLRLWWWRHIGAGRHFWRDLYFETAGFYLTEHRRCEAKSRIIRTLRADDERWTEGA